MKMKYKEIFKLKQMLEDANIPFEFFDNTFDESSFLSYQIIINDKNNEKLCDAIQCLGSYGEKEDLIEIMGGLTQKEGKYDSVLGGLTAEEVFERFKYCYLNNTSIYKEKVSEKMNKKEAFKIVHEFMQNHYPFAKGKDWDKENGNEYFMSGIYSVLDYIEALAKDDIDIDLYNTITKIEEICYVVQFEDGSYWKGQGAKLTKELRSASFLRKCDIEGINLDHIKWQVESKYNLKEPKIIKVKLETLNYCLN